MEETNKLIAEFMGYEYMTTQEIMDWLGLKTTKRFDRVKSEHKPTMKKGDDVMFDDFFEYHKSWNWLMPVIEKIESTDCSEFAYTWEGLEGTEYNFSYPKVMIEGKECWVYFDQQLDPYLTIADFKEGSKLENTYNGVVEFIKWYNECNRA